MCGIAGIVGRGASPWLLDEMLEKQVHRGPDGEGRHVEQGIALGMRRLSIIDLAHGWQPLCSREGRVIAFQNGEIYNYRALRAELSSAGCVFQTESDTEILAHGYDAWGFEELLRRIDGMYAIAIFDRDKQTLHLARDRFGEKPLFLMAGYQSFAYASSLKSLAAMPWFDETIDPAAVDNYLALHYVPGDRTIFRSVRRLPPGCYLTVTLDRDGGVETVGEPVRYYQLKLTLPVAKTDDELAEAIDSAVRSRLVADVPVGVFLSGGIDSSIIAAVAKRYNQEISTYSVGFPGFPGDEAEHAEVVARSLGTRHHTYAFDAGRFMELLPEVAAALDEPIGDQATLPLHWLCREARREVTVVLSGEGGDELFGGYSYYRPFTAPDPWTSRVKWVLENPDRTCPPLLGETQTASGFPILAGAAERAVLLGRPNVDGAGHWEEEMRGWLNGARDSLQRATAADIGGWLPDNLLVKLDRICMASSLEGRAPFLTPNLASIGLNLPSGDRIGETTKMALRRVAARLLPPEIVERPKQGFVLPMRSWLQEWYERQGDVRSYFLQAAFPGFDGEAVARLVSDDLASGVARERLIFALTMLTEWWKALRQN